MFSRKGQNLDFNKSCKLIVICVIVLGCGVSLVNGGIFDNPLALSVRKAPRWNFPFFGISCNGCPPRTCENDPAIIYGYCCGCAKVLDRLPVLCPQILDCPLNGAPLCHDYEYMMKCCC